MILKTIGHNIRELRKQAHMRQIDLAVMVGIDCSYLSAIENGKRNPSILLLQNIATVLNVSAKNYCPKICQTLKAICKSTMTHIGRFIARFVWNL